MYLIFFRAKLFYKHKRQNLALSSSENIILHKINSRI